MVSYVNVDYQKLDEIIKRRGTNRSKCAAAIGVSPGAIANSFKRSSKMRLDQMKMLANFLQVAPLELIPEDSINSFTVDQLCGQNASDKDQIISEALSGMLNGLNKEGKAKLLKILYEIAELIHRIPEYCVSASGREAEYAEREREKNRIPSSYVSVDYAKINKLFNKRGTTRSKCAKACGIHPSTLGNAFMRESKMRANHLKKIAAFLGVQPLDLILHDKDGSVFR